MYHGSLFGSEKVAIELALVSASKLLCEPAGRPVRGLHLAELIPS